MLSHLEAIAVIVLSADPREKEGKKKGEKRKNGFQMFFFLPSPWKSRGIKYCFIKTEEKYTETSEIVDCMGEC